MLVYDGMVLIRKILIDKATMNWVYLLILQGLRGLVKFWIKTFSKKTHLILKTLLTLKTLLKFKTLLKKRNRKIKWLLKNAFEMFQLRLKRFRKFSVAFFDEKKRFRNLSEAFSSEIKRFWKMSEAFSTGKNAFETHQ